MVDRFLVQYQGAIIEFTLLPDRNGYGYSCPGRLTKHTSRAFNWIDTESGTRHKLTIDQYGRATVVGSLLCRQCGWHVLIKDGIASDA